jgi:hypothetical protein
MFKTWSIALILIVAVLSIASEAQAQKKTLKLTQEWSGSVADDALLKGTPECIATEAAFDKLWKKWKLPGKTPGVDFAKEIVVIATTSGSKLSLTPRLADNGDLELLGIATSDFGPGFRFVIGVVSRDGVKTVNGKKLPKE